MERPLIDYLRPEKIDPLARRADVRYGQAIYARGGVELITETPARVEGWVGGLTGRVTEGGGQRRRTQRFVTPQGLAWHCAGNPKQHQIFCKHCVALALSIVDRAAKQ